MIIVRSKKRQQEVALLVEFFQEKIDINVLAMASIIKKLDYKACVGSISMQYGKPVNYVSEYVVILRAKGWVRLGRYRVHSYSSKHSQRLHLTEIGLNSLNQNIESYRKYKKRVMDNNEC